MGNAALCSSCHAAKSVRAQGNMLELDTTPDYYGCNSDDVKEPDLLVSVRPQPGGHCSKDSTVMLIGQISQLPGRKLT